MILFSYHLRKYSKFLRSKPIKLATVIASILMVTGCNYTAFDNTNDKLIRPSLERGNAIEVIPTGMSLPNLHTIEDIIIGNPEFGAAADILNTYDAVSYLKQFKAVTLIIPMGREFDVQTCKYFETIFQKNGTKGIVAVLLSHTIDGRYDKASIISKTNPGELKVMSLNKETIMFSTDFDRFYVVSDKATRAEIKIFNQMATNGIVHGIEHWLLPHH